MPKSDWEASDSAKSRTWAPVRVRVSSGKDTWSDLRVFPSSTVMPPSDILEREGRVWRGLSEVWDRK